MWDKEGILVKSVPNIAKFSAKTSFHPIKAVLYCNFFIGGRRVHNFVTDPRMRLLSSLACERPRDSGRKSGQGKSGQGLRALDSRWGHPDTNSGREIQARTACKDLRHGLQQGPPDKII